MCCCRVQLNGYLKSTKYQRTALMNVASPTAAHPASRELCPCSSCWDFQHSPTCVDLQLYVKSIDCHPLRPYCCFQCSSLSGSLGFLLVSLLNLGLPLDCKSPGRMRVMFVPSIGILLQYLWRVPSKVSCVSDVHIRHLRRATPFFLECHYLTQFFHETQLVLF